MSYELDHIETLIARDIDNSLSPEEKSILQSWLNEDAANQRYYDTLKSTWALAAKAHADFDPATEKNWELFRRHITDTGKRSFLHTYRTALRIAASVILLGGAAVSYFVFLHHPEVKEFTQAREKKTITLPDGSKVFLNQESSLHYTAGFNGSERAVHLEGEAFFEVTQQSDKPFVVYTKHTQTQVLGTSFDVKSYDPVQVEVSVVSGKVAFSGRNNSLDRLVLSGGSKGVLQQSKLLKQMPIEDPNFMAWKENRLSFQDTRISDVINTLENYFDVQIELASPETGRLRYNGTFDPEQLASVDSVLEVICPTVNLRWSREGGQNGKYVLVAGQ